MDFLFALPASIKIGSCFATMLALYRLKVPLAWSVMTGTVLLTVLTGTGTNGFRYLVHAMMLPQNFLMLIVIMLLSFFSDTLSHTGRMEKTMDAFKGVIKNPRALAGGLPAIIGLLPMPGGALFSAPFLASTDRDGALSAEHKSAINYWFRHIWEYWWPLYPGVILALKYTGLPFGLFFIIQAPFTIASVVGGYFFLLRRIPNPPVPRETKPRESVRTAFTTLWPIGILVVVSMAASLVLPHAGVSSGSANCIGMIAGLLIALFFIFRGDPALLKSTVRNFAAPDTWLLTLVIAGVLLFAAILQMPLNPGGNTLVSLMRDEFVRLHVPLIIIIILIPFISGFVTGISVGFVGASFPIVFALLGAHPPLAAAIATTSLAYAAGYIGIMLSPVHICFLMSNDYFKASMAGSYRFLALPVAIVALTALGLYALYRFVI